MLLLGEYITNYYKYSPAPEPESSLLLPPSDSDVVASLSDLFKGWPLHQHDMCDKYSGGDTNTTHSTSMICATTGARMGCTGTWDVAKRTKHDFSTHYYDDKAAIRVRECLR